MSVNKLHQSGTLDGIVITSSSTEQSTQILITVEVKNHASLFIQIKVIDYFFLLKIKKKTN